MHALNNCKSFYVVIKAIGGTYDFEVLKVQCVHKNCASPDNLQYSAFPIWPALYFHSS